VPAVEAAVAVVITDHCIRAGVLGRVFRGGDFEEPTRG